MVMCLNRQIVTQKEHHMQTCFNIATNGARCTLEYHETCFREVNKLEAVIKIHLQTCTVHMYTYFEKQWSEGGDTISPLLSCMTKAHGLG